MYWRRLTDDSTNTFGMKPNTVRCLLNFKVGKDYKYGNSTRQITHFNVR